MQLPPLLARRQAEGPVIAEIVSQHVEEAAFLWALREGAVRSPRYDLEALVTLEDRLQAHLVGASLAPALAEDLCMAALSDRDPSASFVAFALGMSCASEPLLGCACEALAEESADRSGLIGAGEWVGPPLVERSLHLLSMAQVAPVEQMRVRSYLNARLDPGALLGDWLDADDSTVRALAAQTCGVLVREDLAPTLASRDDDDDAVRFWCRWSRVFLGEPAELLREYLEAPGPFTEDALALALRRLPVTEASAWVRALGRAGEYRLAVLGAVATGDSAHVPWLLESMGEATLARQAGAAFAWITGVSARDAVYAEGAPSDAPPAPTDDPADPLVALGEDDDLPWPDADAHGDWWRRHAGQLPAGRRYLRGKIPSGPVALDALASCAQHERPAAAAELARLCPGEMLFPTTWRARQQRTMIRETSQGDGAERPPCGP